MKRLPILAIAVVAAVAMALVAGNALAKIQIRTATMCVSHRAETGELNDEVQVTFELYDDGTPTVDTMGNTDVKIDNVVQATVRNASPLPYKYPPTTLSVPKKAKHTSAFEYWGNNSAGHTTLLAYLGDCVWPGGIAEASDAEASALGATASGGSSGTTYAVIASIAAGIVLLGAGGWYARRRWLS